MVTDADNAPYGGWVRTGGLLAGLGGLIVGALLTACSAGPAEPGELAGWQPLVLPDGMVPATLQVIDDTLLVGGHRVAGAGRTPVLAQSSPDQAGVSLSPIPLTPTTPYGKVADLVSLTGSNGRVAALGAAHGGAHANFRWTVWTGTAGRLVDRPQTFETFGGWDAGTLLGLATDRRGPLIVGTWQGPHGPDGAVWRVEGERWVRQPTAPAMANTAERQVGPRTVSQQADGSVVVNGSVIDLRDGVHQSAAYWRDVDGSWSLTALADPGRRSESWSTACGPVCWSVGGRDGAIAVWAGGRRVEAPDLPIADADTGIVLVSGDRTVVAVTSNGAGRLLVSGADRAEGADGAGDWRVYLTPGGPIRDAEVIDTRLYLLTGTPDAARLVVRDLADVLDR